MSAIEKTLVLVKPDGVKKHICGEVISRFERKGLEVEAIKMIQVPEELAKKHYAEHEGKGFFKDLIAFITSGPVLAMVIKGENAVAAVRQINGATDPLKAVPGSIRGDFATSIDENVVHASDAPETAEREIGLWFPELKK
ncbi:nucleoside-diphosphate kinase [Dialister hominis]|jgi:nucleoside-diphosphate kinase|uniref:nucleoside-diphosphate kinase n=1 Tax=Dialister TaxID=39948 RepID=UPI0003394CB9|nr:MULTISPECIES: nucleoside-diphosphate kinase [environmental samples]MCH3912346.1 nucleoside-diphosphate kinase [Dialister sp.]HJI42782.1 nucleoside-diphosphate kinase [Veillonellaceae bacterium]MCH3929898.1 nucleoside-diphosphate kinase [Dialister sp.]CDD81214.1 nucleoside diphosphate kinase [Dialister sp. CAG:357]HJI73924.1 nucleoside-diphosphate kinase [Veillonellaceae bacterium]